LVDNSPKYSWQDINHSFFPSYLIKHMPISQYGCDEKNRGH